MKFLVFLFLLLNMHQTFLQYAEENELLNFLETLLEFGSSTSWSVRLGSILALASVIGQCPNMVCESAVFSSVILVLENALEDDKVSRALCLSF